MKRRSFLQKVGVGTIGAAVLNHLPINLLADSPVHSGLAASDTDHVLVVVFLSGGNDGLNTVIPLDQYSNLSKARANILIPEDKILKFPSFEKIGLHPAMSSLHNLSKEGKVSIIQNVGYPNPNYSHFRATDIWNSGSESNQILSNGWAGRYLSYEYPGFPNGFPNDIMPDPLSISIGSTPLCFQGLNTYMGVNIADPKNVFSMATGIEEPSPGGNAGKELVYLREVARQSDKYSSAVFQAYDKVKAQYDKYPADNSLANQLKTVARLIAGGLKTRMYFVSLTGFDTHSAQISATDKTQGTHATLLKKVSEALESFQRDLEFLSVDNRVVTMTFSEFGRRIKSNDGLGTDHGSAIPMFLMGKKILSGIIGDNPIIPETVDVKMNLTSSIDFRSIYSTLLRDWLCVPESELENILMKNVPFLSLVDNADCRPQERTLLQKAGKNILKIYPNPVDNQATVRYSTQGGGVLIQLLDTGGRILFVAIDDVIAPGTYEFLLQVDNLASGVYYLQIQNENYLETKPLIKK